MFNCKFVHFICILFSDRADYHLKLSWAKVYNLWTYLASYFEKANLLSLDFLHFIICFVQDLYPTYFIFVDLLHIHLTIYISSIKLIILSHISIWPFFQIFIYLHSFEFQHILYFIASAFEN